MGFIQWFMIHIFRKQPKALTVEVVTVETEQNETDDQPPATDA